jgi:hypothetical protein
VPDLRDPRSEALWRCDAEFGGSGHYARKRSANVSGNCACLLECLSIHCMSSLREARVRPTIRILDTEVDRKAADGRRFVGR